MKRRMFGAASRRGAVLPLVVICLICLMGLLALAIDIGMVAVARSQVQNAADAASMAGARTITGAADNNFAAVPLNAIKAATYNKVLGQDIKGDWEKATQSGADTYTAGQVKVEGGAYSYIYNDSDASKEGFQLTVPGRPTGEPYTAAKVTVSAVSPTSFGRVFRPGGFDVQAVATAVHRPRDVIIIMDLSGSMRFQSLAGMYLHNGTTVYPSSAYPRTVSMNPDPDYPKFGHYSDTAAAALYGNTSYPTSGGEMCDPANLSYKSNSGPAILDDFFENSSTKAFTRGDSGKSTSPGGDDFPKFGGSYVKTVGGYLNGLTDETTLRNWLNQGYTGAGNFKGYSEGPGYWGKTFFMWPPDPRGSDKNANDAANHADNGAQDWRQRFFFKYNPAAPAGSNLFWLDHNNLLWDPAGVPFTSTSATPAPIVRAPGNNVLIKENGIDVNFQLKINYAAIFHWLRSAPNDFPEAMTTGRINYYNKIPDPTGDTDFNNRFWAASSLSNDEKFWKEYVDFMLGLQTSGSTYYSSLYGSVVPSSMIGNGDFFSWGTVQVKQRADCGYWGQINKIGGYAGGAGVIIVDNVKKSIDQSATTPSQNHFIRVNYGSTIYKVTGVASASGVHTLTLDKTLAVSVKDNDVIQFYSAVPRYMDHADNPYRPRHQYWFGPQTWADWLGNYQTGKFWWPGNVHEAQAWACKVGIQTAIDDIKNNHPSDYVGMCFFSAPRNKADDTSGWHNRAIVPLGRNYEQLKESLWFPPTTVTGSAKTITPWDADFDSVPRANGSTCPGMGLMIAYNLLSNSTASLRTYATPSTTYRGNAGGLGRKGADRLVILETDGVPNTRAFATLGGSGKDAYYKIRVKNPEKISDTANEFPSDGTYSATEVYNVVKQITALETADPAGYSNSRKKALVYAIGYGTLFDPAKTSTNQTNALTFLQTVQFNGNTATSSTATDFPDWQRIYGTNENRIERMRDAFTRIMQAGVQVSLIQ